jgi:hypothetical protein
MTADSLTYLYAIVPGDTPAPPTELRGLDGCPVRLVRAGDIAAVVSELPTAQYAAHELNARLTDLPWVGERAVAHERILTWLADRGAVIPLTLFSLHHTPERVRERLEDGAEQFRATLDRLHGRREWGIKLWRTDARLADRLKELSPRLRELTAEIDAAAPGRRFLLSKKRDSIRDEELRTVGAQIARDVYARLRERAEEAVALQVTGGSGPEERVLALHAAFLVEDSSFAAFQDEVTRMAREHQPSGVELEFTGPWPPYHFAGTS